VPDDGYKAPDDVSMNLNAFSSIKQPKEEQKQTRLSLAQRVRRTSPGKLYVKKREEDKKYQM